MVDPGTYADPTGEEYYGGAVAAPLYSSVMRGALRLLNIAPDNYQQALAQTGDLDPAGQEVRP